MIELTGRIAGKDYNEELISPLELLKALKISLPGIDLNKPFTPDQFVILKLTSNKMEFDRRNNVTKYVPKTTLATQIQGATEEGGLIIRYYKNKQKDKNGNYVYSPARTVATDDIYTRFYLREAAELEYLLMAVLNPQCEQSPFTTKSNEHSYLIYDDAEIRSKSLDLFVAKSKFVILIQETDEATLRAKAAGMKFNGRQIVFETYAKITSIKQIMCETLEAHPEEFMSQWKDSAVNLKGLCSQLFNEAMVMSEMVPGGKKRIKWNAMYHGGKTIIEGSEDTDQVELLMRHVVKYYESFMDESKTAQTLKKASSLNGGAFEAGAVLNPSSIAVKPKHEQVDDYTIIQVIDESLAQDFIYLERSTGKIFRLQHGKHTELLKVKADSNYKEEFKIYLGANLAELKALKNRLKYFYVNNKDIYEEETSEENATVLENEAQK